MKLRPNFRQNAPLQIASKYTETPEEGLTLGGYLSEPAPDL